MLVIKKVLNSSVVLVNNAEGQEQILLQKGVGYGRKPGEEIEFQENGQLFVPFIPADRQNMLQLLAEVPAVYPELAREIVLYAEDQLQIGLNPHIYLALTDHLHFAVEREKKGMVVTNRVLWEMKTFYRKEYAIGIYALERVRKMIGVRLPEEEAANIAFHIANARNEDANGDAMRDAKLIGKIVMLVTYSMHYQPDQDSIHYARFISHLQFFVQRFYSGNMLDSEDDFLYHQMREGYPQALGCAEKVRTLLLKEHNVCISNEEVAYLTIHIQRLTYKV